MLERIEGEKNIEGKKLVSYRCSETGTPYTRTGGGIHWPDMKQGFVCIVGEVFSAPTANGRRPLRVLHEARVDNLPDLAFIPGDTGCIGELFQQLDRLCANFWGRHQAASLSLSQLREDRKSSSNRSIKAVTSRAVRWISRS